MKLVDIAYFMHYVPYMVSKQQAWYESSSPQTKDMDWWSLRTGCWEEYLDLKEMKKEEDGEDCVMRSFIICILHQTLFEWSNGGWVRQGK